MTLYIPHGDKEERPELRDAAKFLQGMYSIDTDNAPQGQSHLIIRHTEEGYELMPYCGTVIGVYKKPRTPKSKNLMPSDGSSATIDGIVEVHPRFTE